MSLKLRSEKARENKKNHGLVRLLAGAAIIVVAVYVVYSIISNNIAIRDNMKRYNELVAETNAILAKNEQIEGYLQNDADLDNYITDMARDKLDFAKSDERIYYVVPAAGG